MTNTLRQVATGDLTNFKSCLDTFIDWYVRNCEGISKMAEAWGEGEDDTLTSIFTAGIIKVAERTEIMKEADSLERFLQRRR